MNIATTTADQALLNISNILLSSLDEEIFFGHLSQFLSETIGADRILVYKILENTSAKLVSVDGKKAEKDEVVGKGEGIVGYVVRTKKPYFSNNVSRDPIFNGGNSIISHRAELVIPLQSEGFLMGTLHFQRTANTAEFTREDINTILRLLNELHKPITNMKLYLSAKNLNEVLLKKIEQKEQELLNSSTQKGIADLHLISEKELVGKNEKIRHTLEVADKVAQSEVSVLIEGESGTGRELLAKRIHCRGPRKNMAFVIFDCAAFSNEGQLELDLFGCDRDKKVGALEKAGSGTILISNVSRLSMSMQTRLTTVLKDKIISKVGGGSTKFLARIIAIDSKNLKDLVALGSFREDLSYLLSMVKMEMPSLKERKEDIEGLANYFLNNGKSVEHHKSFSPGAVQLLNNYRWPGNIRELQNIVERAFILAEGRIIDSTHLPDALIHAPVASVETEVEEEDLGDFREMTLNDLEKRHIVKTLEHLAGNKTRAAKALGITVKTLYNKLHCYGMIDARDA